MDKKVCNKCKEEKPLDDFSTNRSRKDGKCLSCKICSSIARKEWGIKNPEKVKTLKKRYRENNRERVSFLKKQYRINNLEKVKESNKRYRENNREKVNENGKKWKRNNPDKMKILRKRYRDNNIETVREINKLYVENNREKVKESNKRYMKKRTDSDPVFKAIISMRSRLRSYVKQKSLVKRNSFTKVIGITPDGFRVYIESLFQEGMSWDNHRIDTWHLDHIIPLSVAQTIEDVERLSHYTNIQPLWAKDNHKKSNKIL